MSAEAVLNAQAKVDKGENARMSSFVGAIAVADLVKSTLGPKGMDKILQSMSDPNGGITITNDGATILRSIYIDNAAAKVNLRNGRKRKLVAAFSARQYCPNQTLVVRLVSLSRYWSTFRESRTKKSAMGQPQLRSGRNYLRL